MLESDRRPTLHTDASGTAPPDAFGPFRVLHQIGAGTLGPIFRAYQPDPGRLVAVKQFRLGFSPESASRFVAALEGIVAADLTHTGIAAPIAAGAIDSTPYLALDFVAADSLDVVVREYGPLPVGDILRFTRQLGRALDVAAAAGVLHGALHPRDLLMTADDVRLTGLGIAAALEAVGLSAPLRRPYSAPERSAGGPWDRRADVFSLAALTYEMLVGRPIVGVGAEAADGLTSIEGADSVALHALFSKALAADPGQRIATASAFVGDLRAVLPSPERQAGGKRKKTGATAATDSLFDVPLAPPEPAADEPFDHSLFRDGDYVEGDASRSHDDLDTAEARDVEVNLSAIDLRLDENLREGSEELRLRTEADEEEEADAFGTVAPVAAAPAVAGVTGPDIGSTAVGVDDDEPVLATDASDVSETWAREGEPGGYDRVHDPDDISGDLADDFGGARSQVPAAQSPADDVPLSPVTPAYSSLPGEAPESRNWPILLGVVVGVLVGTAFGYVVGTRQHSDAPGAARVASVQTAPDARAAAPTDEEANAPADAAGASPATRSNSSNVPAAASRGDAATGSNGPARTDTRESAVTASAPAAASNQAGRPAAAAAPARQTAVAPSSAAAAAPPREPTRPAPAGRLIVRSRPSGARVSIDGRDAGVTPATVTNLSVGAHNVRISRDGYVAAERRVRIRSAQASQSIDVALAAVRSARRPPTASASTAPTPSGASGATADRATGTRGSLTVNSRPAGARVFVDGRQVGVTPLQLDAVDAGSHAVRLELDGFGPWATTVQVVGGQGARVSGSLER